MSNILVEVAVESADHAVLAEKYGADRIELCASLSQGGLTPNYGLISKTIASVEIPVHVMLRPRAGDFCYSETEFEIIKDDAKACAQLGVRGVVFGFLKDDLALDIERTVVLVNLCHRLGLKTSFHRAIDICINPEGAIVHLIDLEVENILTSGRRSKAIDGIETISKWHQTYGNDINIMAGSGITKDNVQAFIDKEIQTIHFTSHKKEDGLSADGFAFGEKHVFDPNRIEGIIEIIKKNEI